MSHQNMDEKEKSTCEEDNERDIEGENRGVRMANILTFGFAIIFSFYLILQFLRMSQPQMMARAGDSLLQWNTVFLSILLQAFPFLLIGVIISSFAHTFVSQEFIIKYFPGRSWQAYLVAVVTGVFLPVCDCAIVPVATRLIKKGVPADAAIVFMLAAPIVNPIVITSTLVAFPGQPMVAVTRVLLGVLIAVIVGIVLRFMKIDTQIIRRDSVVACSCHGCSRDHDDEDSHDHECSHEDEHTRHNHECGHDHTVGKLPLRESIFSMIQHIGTEFYSVGRYLIVGTLITSAYQVFLAKNFSGQAGSHQLASLVFMMLVAFLLSVCSSSDAFIAKSFTGNMTIGSIMGFLVLGPMLDIKNVMMLLSGMKKTFVAKLIAVILLVSAVILTLQLFLLKW